MSRSRYAPGRKRFVHAMLALTFLMSSGVAAIAEDSPDFYAGKTVSVLIPSSTGGGYDAYGRLVARHLGKHIPGRPSVVPQNKPGAGGIVLANYLANAAPKDGTVVAIMQNGIPLTALLDPRPINFKNSDFKWLGSVTPVTNIGVVSKNASVKSAKDLFSKQVTLGGSGGVSIYVPAALSSVLRADIKLVRGYSGTAEIFLAMQRGEVDGLFGVALDSFRQSPVSKPEDVTILFQAGLKRNRDLPDAPLIQEFAKSPHEKLVLDTIFASFQIGRLIATNNVPADRLAILQKATWEMMSDPEFVADAKNLKLDVNPQTASEIEDMIAGVYAQPKGVITEARAIMAGSE